MVLVGGGGFLSGMGFFVYYFVKNIKVIGVEFFEVDDVYCLFYSGEI